MIYIGAYYYEELMFITFAFTPILVTICKLFVWKTHKKLSVHIMTCNAAHGRRRLWRRAFEFGDEMICEGVQWEVFFETKCVIVCCLLNRERRKSLLLQLWNINGVYKIL
jgi:hypothetical protein